MVHRAARHVGAPDDPLSSCVRLVMSNNLVNKPCPCGSGKKYKKCCRPFLESTRQPGDPEALMRSRYTAYALGEVDYIVDTTSARAPERSESLQTWRMQIEQFIKHTEFEGLTIESSRVDGDTGHVTFLATLTQAGLDASFREHSLFERANGRWFYVDAEEIEELGEDAH